MKPDQFADQIRRKLESIEPTFRDKDWVQMQHTMRVHGGGVYQPGLPQWVMPTVGGLAVASLATVVYFQYATNQKLQNEVQTLNQTVTQLRQTPQATEQPPDTVYVTRYIEAPSTHLPTWKGGLSNEPIDRSLRDVRRGGSQLADSQQPKQEVYTDEAGNVLVPNPSLNSSVNETTTTSSIPRRNGPVSTDQSNRSTQLANSENGPTINNGRQRSGSTLENNSYPVAGTNRTGIDKRGNDLGTNPANQYRVSQRDLAGNNLPYKQYGANSGRNGSGNAADIANGRQNGAANNRQGGMYDPQTPVETAQPTTEPLSWALPDIEDLPLLSITADSAYYREGMVKISRRIRRLLPVIAAQTATKAPTVTIPVPDWRFRLGIGGFVGVQQFGGGLFSEVRLGSGWIIGVGLTNNRLSGATYLTDHLYEERTKRNFRKEYAGGIDPRYEILNITRKATTWQVPVTVGYRIQMQKNWSVNPTVGVSFNISNQEKIAFNYLRTPPVTMGGPSELEERYLLIQYQKSYMHTALFSVGIEKTWQRISVQAGPYMSLPTTVNPYTLNTASGGMRARLFYRF